MADDAPETTSELKKCSLCRTPKPIDEFRLRRRDGSGGRHRECQDCHNLAEKIRRLKKRLDDVDRFAKRVADEQQANRVIDLANAMILRFKGTDRLAALWDKAILRAMQTGRVEALLHHHGAVMWVLGVCGFVRNERSERGAEK